MRDKDIEISVVIPVYNSAQTLRELRERLEKVLRDLVGESYEIVFVNDGSTDSSWDLLNEMASTSDKIVGVNLTRNFGQHNALMCGFSQAQGMYIITLDDDLQNPPEEIPKLFNEIQTGHDVVYGIFDIKQHSKFRNLGSEFVQFVYRKTFNMNIRISSFRIIRREIIQRIMSYEKSFTYIDGLISWFTNNIGSVLVEHHQRQEGKSGYSLKKLMVLALNMVTNFSIVPLQIASLTGLVFALVGFGFGIYFLLKKALLGMSISGFASTIVSITIFSGVQLVTAGILGEYIGRIHINVNKRPQYAIRDIVNEGKNET
jgi:polyisoprenyl-phosphate glycosyltransferase